MTSTAISKPTIDSSYDFSGSLFDDDENSDLSPTPLTRSASYEEEIWITDYTDIVLEFIIPIVWSILFMIIMDRQSFFELFYMPFLGIAAALLANSVPIGGGIVYIPVLHLLGVNLHLGVAFTVATMPIGNGIFGFLRWLKKNPDILIWESFPYTVISSSIGTAVALYVLPRPNVVSIKRLFGGFCVLLGILVGIASRNGGIAKAISPYLKDITIVSTPAHTSFSSHYNSSSTSSDIHKWLIISIVSFLAGMILVPNIGVGPALTTYLMLEMFGYEAEQAIVTGVVTGGWVCILPFLIHLLEYRDVPLKLWIMVLPGVYYGAKLAPLCHEYIGIKNILSAFSIFLFASSYIFFSSI